MNERLEIASRIAAGFASSIGPPLPDQEIRPDNVNIIAQASLKIADALIKEEERTALEAKAELCDYCYGNYRCPWHRDENQPPCRHCGHPFYIHHLKGCVAEECSCPGYRSREIKS